MDLVAATTFSKVTDASGAEVSATVHYGSIVGQHELSVALQTIAVAVHHLVTPAQGGIDAHGLRVT
eukprot:CAMPEP_0198115120 /NCGR_PEP_ID=MMETSP1442-20131203/6315_1 /TAXON_ID= /ORGANISM="Craspedostauros australis, Strain CCMP3328" /LENGTH=65 /DNA_ID=CAMNT_0043772559 /DNA_START=359 /DNA_END=552 /DNA_ORIENTATION=+